MHSRWLKTRRHFYESLQNEIELITGPPSKELQTYQKQYEKCFDVVWDVFHWDSCMEELSKSHIVLAGDYHYLYQSQRTHFRVLRELIPRRTGAMTLMLEVFDHRDQKWLDAYVDGQIQEKQFLKKVSWEKHWKNLSPQGYLLLLHFCREHKIKVLALNDFTKEELDQRDSFSGRLIEDYIQKNPETFVYVIYGDFHLADGHLVDHIPSYTSSRDRRLFLNSDQLYFQLSEHAVEEQFDVLKNQDCLCVLSCTPWVKLQSYLLYLQEADDYMIFQVDDYEDEGVFEPDYTDYISEILKIFMSDFDLPNFLSYLDVLIATDSNFKKLDYLKLKEAERDKLSFFIRTQKNIIFPKDDLQFLAKPSVNHAMSLAGEFVHSKMSQRKSLVWSGAFFMQKRIWIEAVAYFFTLWLNPKLKTMKEKDLINHLKAIGNTHYAEDVLKYAVAFRLFERESEELHLDPPHLKADWNIQIEASSVLGQIMGKKLYRAYKAGHLPKSHLLNYLSMPLESSRFSGMYAHLVKLLDQSIIE